MSLLSIVLEARLSNATRKDLVLAGVDRDGNITYFSIDWVGVT